MCASVYSVKSMRTSASSVPNSSAASARAKFGLADAARPDEEKAAHRPARILEAGAAAPDRLRDGADRVGLTDDPLLERQLEREESARLLFGERALRNAGPLRNDRRDVGGLDERVRPACATEAEASSIRSIALSGKKRSTM